MLRFFIIGIVLFFAMPVWAGVDLGIRNEDIDIVPLSGGNELIAGQKARVYAKVHNFGSIDAVGIVSFFQGAELLGKSQPISLRANGFADEVFIDITIPGGSFNIFAKLQQVSPEDTNPANDESIGALQYPVPDSDGDGIPDYRDNCPSIFNSNQIDTDGDKSGNECDPDDDNDGLADIDEIARGTNPLDPDTDKDGIIDSQDPNPLSPDVSPLSKPVKKLGAVSGVDTTSDPIVAKAGVIAKALEPIAAKESDSTSSPIVAKDNVQADAKSEAYEEAAPEYEITIPVEPEKKARIPSGLTSAFMLAALISAVCAGIFAFLALRMRTPKE